MTGCGNGRVGGGLALMDGAEGEVHQLLPACNQGCYHVVKNWVLNMYFKNQSFEN